MVVSSLTLTLLCCNLAKKKGLNADIKARKWHVTVYLLALHFNMAGTLKRDWWCWREGRQLWNRRGGWGRCKTTEEELQVFISWTIGRVARITEHLNTCFAEFCMLANISDVISLNWWLNSISGSQQVNCCFRHLNTKKPIQAKKSNLLLCLVETACFDNGSVVLKLKSMSKQNKEVCLRCV